MAKTVGDFILERLRLRSPPHLRLSRRRHQRHPRRARRPATEIEFIQARHEEMAAFMACAHAKFTGEVGVCLATSGPGAIHLLNGLYDAKLDHQPVVAHRRPAGAMSLGADYQQEVDLVSLFKDVAERVRPDGDHAGAGPHLIDRAFRIALADRARRPASSCPTTCRRRMRRSRRARTARCTPASADAAPRVLPHDGSARAADVLNAGEQVAILVGQGARGAADEVIAVAELLGAGVAKALLGSASCPTTCRSSPARSACSAPSRATR